MFFLKHSILFVAPLSALILLSIGVSFLTTFVIIEMQHMGGSDVEIGFLMTTFYVGYVIGAYKLDTFIKRVGHIRAYSAFAAITAVVTLFHAIITDTTYWYPMRILYGLCNAGIFIVIESWLLSLAEIKVRGRILALYMLSFYIAQALGQYILKYMGQDRMFAYAVVAILASLSIVPICASKAKTPHILKVETLKPYDLLKQSWSGVSGCLVSGLILGPVFGLLPAVLTKINYNIPDIGKMMAMLILGGAALQYPIGKISDIINRRIVLLFLTVLTIGSTIGMQFFLPNNTLTAYYLAFLFGGTLFAIYPLATNLVCDYLKPEDILPAVGTLLIFYSIGATIGPIFASYFMKFSSNGFYFYTYTCLILYIVLILIASMRKAPLKVEEQGQFSSAPTTTPVAGELNPRFPHNK